MLLTATGTKMVVSRIGKDITHLSSNMISILCVPVTLNNWSVFFRILSHHSEVYLWPFGYKITSCHHFILLGTFLSYLSTCHFRDIADGRATWKRIHGYHQHRHIRTLLILTCNVITCIHWLFHLKSMKTLQSLITLNMKNMDHRWDIFCLCSSQLLKMGVAKWKKKNVCYIYFQQLDLCSILIKNLTPVIRLFCLASVSQIC